MIEFYVTLLLVLLFDIYKPRIIDNKMKETFSRSLPTGRFLCAAILTLAYTSRASASLELYSTE